MRPESITCVKFRDGKTLFLPIPSDPVKIEVLPKPPKELDFVRAWTLMQLYKEILEQYLPR